MSFESINSLNKIDEIRIENQKYPNIAIDKELVQSSEKAILDTKAMRRISRSGIRKMKSEEQLKFNTLKLNRVYFNSISEEAISIILKYGNNPMHSSPLLYAIQIQDLDAAEILIKEQLFLNEPGLIKLPFSESKSELTPLLALKYYMHISPVSQSPDSLGKYLNLIDLCIENLDLKRLYNLKSYDQNGSLAGTYQTTQIPALLDILNRYSLTIHIKDIKERANLLEKCFEIAKKILKKGKNIDSFYEKSLIEVPIMIYDYSTIELLILFGIKIDKNYADHLMTLASSSQEFFKTHRKEDIPEMKELLEKIFLLLKNISC